MDWDVMKRKVGERTALDKRKRIHEQSDFNGRTSGMKERKSACQDTKGGIHALQAPEKRPTDRHAIDYRRFRRSRRVIVRPVLEIGGEAVEQFGDSLAKYGIVVLCIGQRPATGPARIKPAKLGSLCLDLIRDGSFMKGKDSAAELIHDPIVTGDCLESVGARRC
jgi:hypothetical protein